MKLKPWHWVGIVAIALLVFVLIMAGHSSTARTVTPDAPAKPEASEPADADADLQVDKLMKEISKADQDEEAKKQSAAQVQMGAQNPNQLAQMQQLQTQQEYLRMLQAASQRSTGNGSEQEGEKSFEIGFDDEEPVKDKTAAPAPETADAPVKPDANGGFACGSEASYWTACIPEGSVIMAVTTNELKGDFDGPVITKVSQALLSKDGKSVLIPAGTSVLGEAGRVEGQDQARLAIVFHRMILTDGSAYHPAGWSIPLDKLQGLSVDGSAGQEGHVNHHIASAILAAGAYGALAGFSLAGTGSALTTGGLGQYREGLTEGLGMQGETMVGRFLNRLPTITVPIHTECDVYFSRDVLVK